MGGLSYLYPLFIKYKRGDKMAVRTSYIKATRADKTSTFEGDIYAKKHLKLKDAGIETVTVDGSGNGTKAVSFNTEFDNTPAILLTAQEADTTGILSVTNPTTTSFTIKVSGTSAASALDVAWLAVESG